MIAIENTRLLEAEQQRTATYKSLEQQTATSEVLQVISSSPGDLQPVFAAMLENAVRICDAMFGDIYRWDGEALHLVATHNIPPAFAEARRRSPLRPSPKHAYRSHGGDQNGSSRRRSCGRAGYIEQRDPAIVAAVELGGVRTILAVPMLKENELIGSFSLYRQEVRPFTDKQIALVTEFCCPSRHRHRECAVAERTARIADLEQQTATSEVLEVISNSPTDSQPAFEAIVRSGLRLFRPMRPL